MEGSVSPRSNRLLQLMDDQAYGYLLPHLELVQVSTHSVLYEPEQVLKHALFPVSGLIGRVAMTADGKSTELTLCGADGMIGLSILIGGRPLSSRAIVLSDASSYRVPAHVLLAAWRQSNSFQGLMLRYMHVMTQEIIQIALCNKHHTIEQQLIRWLLTASARLGDGKMHVTQAVISQMLGVRREGITEAAGRLESYGLVKRERGGMSIVDRKALEARCCECYRVTTRHYERMVREIREGLLTGENNRAGHR